jgi:hypothetical protein
MSPLMPTKRFLKQETMEEITEKFMEMVLDIANQKVQDALKKFKTPQIKKLRRHRNN